MSIKQFDLSRRQLLCRGLSAAAAALVAGNAVSAALSTPVASPEVSIENFSPAGKSQGIVHVPKVVKTDAEWHAQLSALAFFVTRQSGTERSFSGPYAESRGNGLYRCICCNTALFDSRTKFDSGTGWPSFWQAISSRNVVQHGDYSFGILWAPISCRRCDAHLGHVFSDGPQPTGLRYCMNSVALQFVPRA